MVQCPEGGKVNVLVGGQVAQEYQVEVKTEGNVRTYTCFIEAVEGEDFEIVTDGVFTAEGQMLLLKLDIDGACVDKLLWCDLGQPHHSVMSVYRTKEQEGMQTRKAYTFAKMQTTTERGAKVLSSEQLESACAISLKLIPYNRIGEVNHGGTTMSCLKGRAPVLVVHEDSKPALFGLSAAPGRDKVFEKRIKCNCDLHIDNSAKTTVVTFKYLPRKWLMAKGFIEESQEEIGDDEVQIDSRRTERVASRRRAREEKLQSLRSVRVKREVKQEIPVKTESTIKGECSESKGMDIVDLTVDGKYVLPSRKIGETIVLDEDSDSES